MKRIIYLTLVVLAIMSLIYLTLVVLAITSLSTLALVNNAKASISMNGIIISSIVISADLIVCYYWYKVIKAKTKMKANMQ